MTPITFAEDITRCRTHWTRRDRSPPWTWDWGTSDGSRDVAQAYQQGMREEMERDPASSCWAPTCTTAAGTSRRSWAWARSSAPSASGTCPSRRRRWSPPGVGAALNGMRPVVDLNFIDFAFGAMDEIVNQAAKMRYMFGTPMPLVIRGSSGVALYAAQHNNSLEALFASFPGLLVALPSTPADTKGLLKSALRGQDPVIFMMHKRLGSMRGEVGGPDDLVPFGQAAIRREGSDVPSWPTRQMVVKALEAAERPRRGRHRGGGHRPAHGDAARPRDGRRVGAKTGARLVVTEAPGFASIASEVARASARRSSTGWTSRSSASAPGMRRSPTARSCSRASSPRPPTSSGRRARCWSELRHDADHHRARAGTNEDTALEQTTSSGAGVARIGASSQTPDQVRGGDPGRRRRRGHHQPADPRRTSRRSAPASGSSAAPGPGWTPSTWRRPRDARHRRLPHRPTTARPRSRRTPSRSILAVQRRSPRRRPGRARRLPRTGGRWAPSAPMDELTAGVVGRRAHRTGGHGPASPARRPRHHATTRTSTEAPDGVERVGHPRRPPAAIGHPDPASARSSPETRGMIGAAQLALAADGRDRGQRLARRAGRRGRPARPRSAPASSRARRSTCSRTSRRRPTTRSSARPACC